MDLKKIFDNVIEGAAPSVEAGVKEALAAGIGADVILKEGLIAAMDEVGTRYEEGDIFVPEMLIAARAMQAGLALLKPHLAGGASESAGKVAIGTVKGDLHDIGKNLVALMLEGAGFEVKDLGVDVSPEKFVETILSDGANIVALSALLTTTMPNMEATIKAVQQAGLRDKVKIIIGGAPITQDYANQIGADGYSADAGRAVSMAQILMSS